MAAPPPTAEHARLIHKLRSISKLDEDDLLALGQLPMRTRSVEAGVDLIKQGDVPTECCFVIDGLVCRYAMTATGGRQIVAFHIPGDLPDRDSLHLSLLDHSIGAVSAARVAFIPHVAVARIVRERPNIAIAFWRDSVIDGGVFRQWLTSVGRRTAKQRVAHLICEMFCRMEGLGLADGDHFSFPVTQGQLGDALGLSSVHINRTVQELRTDGLISWKGSVVTIHDREKLEHSADFDPAYLQLKPL